MKKPFELSKRKDLYEFIVEFFCEKHYPPSLVEMVAATDVKSTSHARYYIEQLIDDGLVKRIQERQARGIIPVGMIITPPIVTFTEDGFYLGGFLEDLTSDIDSGKAEEVEGVSKERE